VLCSGGENKSKDKDKTMSENKYSKGFRFKFADIGKFSGHSDSVVNQLSSGCRIMGITRGDFSLIDLIYSILRKIGKSDIVVCTWSAGIKDANQVKWMLEEDLMNSFTIITDRSYSTRQKKYSVELTKLFGEENIRVSDIHAKFTLISNKDWKIVIRHSMNLNANRTCESFEIDDSDEIYEFYYSFIKHHFDNAENGFQPKRWKTSVVVDSFFAENDLFEEVDFSFTEE